VSTPVTFSDSLSDDHTDPFWFNGGQGTGFAGGETNGRLELSLAADATPDPVTGFLFAGYYGVCQMTGNFDERVSFSLLDWPALNGASAGLKSGSAETGDTGDVFRQSVPWGGELYGFYMPPSGGGTVPASGLTGTMRVVRAGQVTTAYYRADRRWIEIASALSIPGPTDPNLSLEVDGGAFAHQFVRVAFANFSATADGWTCPSWWQDSSPRWGS
jgi:hypothetical protein